MNRASEGGMILIKVVNKFRIVVSALLYALHHVGTGTMRVHQVSPNPVIFAWRC
jgi:hypothetical protein